MRMAHVMESERKADVRGDQSRRVNDFARTGPALRRMSGTHVVRRIHRLRQGSATAQMRPMTEVEHRVRPDLWEL